MFTNTNTDIKLSENNAGATIKIKVNHDTDALYGGYLVNVDQVQQNTNSDQPALAETILGGIQVTADNLQQLIVALREAQTNIIAQSYRFDCMRVDINKAVADHQTALGNWTEVRSAYDSSYVRLLNTDEGLVCMARITPDGYVNTSITDRAEEDYHHTVRCTLDTTEINNAINECYAHAMNRHKTISAA
jgi:hypothetical protein